MASSAKGQQPLCVHAAATGDYAEHRDDQMLCLQGIVRHATASTMPSDDLTQWADMQVPKLKVIVQICMQIQSGWYAAISVKLGRPRSLPTMSLLFSIAAMPSLLIHSYSAAIDATQPCSVGMQEPAEI